MIRVFKKISTLKKWIFGHFCDFAKITKRPKNHFFFWKWKFFSAHLNHLGRQFFCIFYTFWFDQKKWAKSKKRHFCAWSIFSVVGPKKQKYQFSWIFLWVILDRKGFLYFWQTPIFEPARAILLKRVRYPEFQPEGLVPYPFSAKWL